MDNKKIGQFISDLRKAKHMTQKDLADKLGVTDKAVSKWERGLNYPDIVLLSSIADILGVTTGELLNGEKSSSDSNDTNTDIDSALQYADEASRRRIKSLQNLGTILFSAVLLIGIIVCAICDMAISGGFTWSLFPISSILFAWFILFPIIRFGTKGIVGSLTALSILIIPFLYMLSLLIAHSSLIMPIGIRMSAIALIFLWIIWGIFKMRSTRKLFASAITLLLVIPFNLFINLTLSKMIDEPIIDIWDIMNSAIFITAAIFFFALDIRARKGAAE